MVPLPILLVTDDCVQIDVLNTPKNVHLDVGTFPPQLPDQLLDLRALGASLPAPSAAAAGTVLLREPAGALDKVQIIVIHPVDDLLLPDQIERAD